MSLFARARSSLAQIWVAYLAVGTLLTLAYLFAPHLKGNGPLINVFGLSSSLAIVAGVLMHRPKAWLAWLLLAFGQLLFFAGDVYTYSYPKLFHHEVPFPSAGDWLYLAVYPALMAGLFMLVRKRNPDGDRPGLIDSAILTVGIALLSWVFLIAPEPPSLRPFAVPEARLVGVSARGRAAPRRRDPPRGRHRQAGARVLSPRRQHRLAPRRRLGLRLRAAQGHLQPPAELRRRLDRLLPPLGCSGPPSVHADARGAGRRSQEPLDPDAPGASRRGVPDRAGHPLRRGVPQSRRRSGGRRGRRCSSCSSSRAWPGWFARRNARSSARSRCAARVSGSSPRPATSRCRKPRWHPPRACSGSTSPSASCSAPTTRRWYGLDGRPRLAALGGVAVVALRCAQGDAAAGDRRSRPRRAPRPAAGRHGRCALLAALDPRRDARGARRRCAGSDGTRVAGLARGAGDAGLARGRGCGARRGSPSSRGRGAVPVARRPLERPDHRARRRRHGDLPEPVDRAPARLLDRRDRGHALRSAPARLGSPEAGADPDRAARLDAGDARDRMLAPASRRDLAAVRGAADEPAPGRARARHRAQQPRRQRAEGLRGPARAPGVPRSGHEPRQPRALRRPRAARPDEDGARRPVRRPSSSSTSTTSRPSTTASATPPATSCCRRSPRGWTRPCVPPTRSPGSAATSSQCCSTASSTRRRRPTSQGASSARSTANLEIDGKEVFPRASVGICIADRELDVPAAEELLRNADVAMYMAKRDSKGGYRIFEPRMHERVVERLEMRAELQRAIDNHQLEVYYQPVVRLDKKVIYGVEALLRWQHPDARADPARPVHPARRGDRPDHPDRPLGARGSVPAGGAPQRDAPAAPSR